jgi:hypothetical protein
MNHPPFNDFTKNLDREYIESCDLPELLFMQELITNTIQNKLMTDREEGITMERWRRLACAERNQ